MEDQKNELRVDEHTAAQLGEAARWARLIGIFGMVASAMLLMAGIFTKSMLQSMNQFNNLPPGMSPSVLTAVYVFLGAFCLLLSFYIFRFGQRMKVALAFGRQDYFNHAFLNLKLLFRILGFIVILNIISYLVGALGALFGK